MTSSLYSEKITHPQLEMEYDVFIWFKRLNAVGLLRHPEDSFLELAQPEYGGLGDETVQALEVARKRVFKVVRDPSSFALAVHPDYPAELLG